MTAGDIVTFVTTKVGQTDADSQAICLDFVNRRYQMIWDSENWTDATVGFTLGAEAGDSTLVLPTSTMERVIKIQIVGGQTLDPVDTEFILDTYPELLSGTPTPGTPRYYEEFYNLVPPETKIQLYPPTAERIFLYLHGKRAFTPLDVTDSPILRNIDNCLIAYVTQDMLQRQRQYTKASQLLDEANTLLDLIRKVEQQNSNKPRASRTLTIEGDSLEEMTASVAARVGDYSPAARIAIQDYIRRCYVDIYNSELWPETKVTATIVRDGPEVILPEYFDRVIEIRANTNDMSLTPMDQSLPYRIDPQVFERVGPAVGFSMLTSVGVTTLPPINEQLVLTSSDATDKSAFFIFGETGGVEVSETGVLNGITGTRSQYTYDVPITVGKKITTGFIDVTGFVSGTLLVRLLGPELQRKHLRIWMQPTPGINDDIRCLVLGKRRCKPLVADQDTPIIRGISNILINLAVTDMFTRIGNKDGASAAQTKADMSMSTLINREILQNAYAPRVVPYVDQYGTDSGGWLGDKFYFTR